jgi:hypothetical protein
MAVMDTLTGSKDSPELVRFEQTMIPGKAERLTG